MTQFAQIGSNVFLNTDKIYAFHIQLNEMQDMVECHYSIRFRDSYSPVYLNCGDTLPIKFQSEEEAVSYLKRYLDNGMRLLD
jgi:hypothetical protein